MAHGPAVGRPRATTATKISGRSGSCVTSSKLRASGGSFSAGVTSMRRRYFGIARYGQSLQFEFHEVAVPGQIRVAAVRVESGARPSDEQPASQLLTADRAEAFLEGTPGFAVIVDHEEVCHRPRAARSMGPGQRAHRVPGGRCDRVLSLGHLRLHFIFAGRSLEGGGQQRRPSWRTRREKPCKETSRAASPDRRYSFSERELNSFSWRRIENGPA